MAKNSVDQPHTPSSAVDDAPTLKGFPVDMLNDALSTTRGASTSEPSVPVVSADARTADLASLPKHLIETDETLVPDHDITSTITADTAPVSGPPPRHHTTVLPRIKSAGQGLELIHSNSVRFETIKALGEGGVGEVVLAKDHDIHREVAIKNLKQQSPDQVVRFIDEVRVLGRLEHPNIVPVYDVGIDANQNYFLVMKYLEGDTLEAVIERLRDGCASTHARFTFTRRVQLITQILRALHAAHSQGIVHRDLKPANIMVGPQDEVVVMDWGLAKALDRDDAPHRADDSEANGDEPMTVEEARRVLFRTRHGSLLGTPAYMAPEQAHGLHDEVAPCTDLYSVGVMFYELMTLQHYLDDHRTLNSMLLGVVSHTPRFPTLINHPHQPTVPAEYAHIIMRSMSKDKADRFQSAEAMLVTLEDALAGKFAIQCPVTGFKQVSHRLNRMIDGRPRMVLITLSLVIFLFLGSMTLSLVLLVR